MKEIVDEAHPLGNGHIVARCWYPAKSMSDLLFTSQFTNQDVTPFPICPAAELQSLRLRLRRVCRTVQIGQVVHLVAGQVPHTGKGRRVFGCATECRQAIRLSPQTGHRLFLSRPPARQQGAAHLRPLSAHLSSGQGHSEKALQNADRRRRGHPVGRWILEGRFA